MVFLIAATFFALGTIVASFVGVIAARLNTGQSFLVGRSRCDVCDEVLEPRSLIPVFSYLTSGGRSSCCDARTSLLAPLTELLLGGLFVLSYLQLGLTLAFFCMLLSLALLLALVLYDLAHQILPTPLLALFTTTSALTGFLLTPDLFSFGTSFYIAFLLALILAAIHFFSRGRAMGFADAPLVFALSLLTGSTALTGFVFSFWIGAVLGIVLLAGRPPGSRMGVEVPFAPYLAAGFLLAYFTQWNIFDFVPILSLL